MGMRERGGRGGANSTVFLLQSRRPKLQQADTTLKIDGSNHLGKQKLETLFLLWIN